jgi:peptidyl-prolyl cis-trans isomerase B (cyclophilin B)
VIAIVLLAAVSGCAPKASDGPDQMHANAPLPSAQVSATPQPTEGDSMLHVSSTVVTGTERAVIETSKGRIVIEFFAEDAPNTVASFIELAEAGFYDGIRFHRVVPRFVVQAGDPQTKGLSADEVRAIVARQEQQQYVPGEPVLGTGGPGWNQKAEFNSRKHLAGTVAMARSREPDSAGSQFYICLEPQPSRDGQYTVFGQVVEGMDVVRTIEVGDEIVSVTIER